MRALLEQIFLSPVSIEQYNWILSATAQALAAVFALYFTVLIFGTQAASRFNPKAFRDVFRRFSTGALTSIFIITIVFSLIFLREPNEWKIWLAIGGAITCLVFLALDFFFALSTKLIQTDILITS